MRRTRPFSDVRRWATRWWDVPVIIGVVACWTIGLLGAPPAMANDYPIPCPAFSIGTFSAAEFAPGVSPVAETAEGCAPTNPAPPATTPPPGNKLSDHASNALIAAGSVVGGLGAGLLVAAATVTAPVWVPWVGAGLLVGGLATLWYAGTHSPANRHFRTIVKPLSIKIRAIKAPTANLQAAAAVSTTLIARNLTAYADAKAFWASEDRAHGAKKAHNKVWYKRQLKAAAGYATRSAKLFKGLPRLQTQLQTKLSAAGTQDIVTAQQIASGQAQPGASQALSTEFRRLGITSILRRLGLTKLINREVRTSTPRTVQFPQSLSDPAVVAADKQAALALFSYAKIARRQERLKF
jgi:hypothetical protein